MFDPSGPFLLLLQTPQFLFSTGSNINLALARKQIAAFRGSCQKTGDASPLRVANEGRGLWRAGPKGGAAPLRSWLRRGGRRPRAGGQGRGRIGSCGTARSAQVLRSGARRALIGALAVGWAGVTSAATCGPFSWLGGGGPAPGRCGGKVPGRPGPRPLPRPQAGRGPSRPSGEPPHCAGALSLSHPGGAGCGVRGAAGLLGPVLTCGRRRAPGMKADCGEATDSSRGATRPHPCPKAQATGAADKEPGTPGPAGAREPSPRGLADRRQPAAGTR